MKHIYPVNEIFQSIQGEATFTGTPSIFVRLQGCPVGCAWCDTKHTWEIDPKFVVNKTIMLAKEKDIILVAGKGHENYQEIKGVKHDFDDMLITKDLFKKLEK